VVEEDLSDDPVLEYVDPAATMTSFDAPLVLSEIWKEHRASVLERVELLDGVAAALGEGALAERSREEARRIAHMLVGSVGTFGFIRASEVARAIERELREPGSARAPQLLALVAELREELQRGLPPAASRPPSVSVLEPEGSQAPLADMPRERPLLMVVDGDAGLCESLKDEAGALGIDCVTAASPERARALCQRRAPGIVLLDLAFADGASDAYALLSELTSATPPIPVLILTGSDAFTDRVEAARRGGRAFLSKSLSPTQVLDAVRQVLARDRQTAARVLIVDDDPVMLDAMCALLEPHDLEITGLTDPLRFWETLELAAPELLILDVDMPGVNGPELCRTVRNDPLWSRLAVIFATARTDAATIERVFQAGADDYVTKPIIGPELVTRVTNRLDRVRMYRSQAETDSLTGLANRAKASESLGQLMAFVDRFCEPMSVAMLDIDSFKLVNDRHGHACGDRVLRCLAEHLQRDFRGEDVIGRWGGEEFLLGMYGMKRQDALHRLAATLERFRAENFGAGSGAFRVTFSAGVAEYPLDGADLDGLILSADQALYRAKAAGRGRIEPAAQRPGSP
jgi:diguanylate cyclase (GGDEF)-like protein